MTEIPVLGGDGHALGYVREDADGWRYRVIGEDAWTGPYECRGHAEDGVWAETRYGPIVRWADSREDS